MATMFERYWNAVQGGFEVMLKQIDLIRKAGAILAGAKIAGGRWVMYDRGWAMSLDTWTRGSNPCHNYLYRNERFGIGSRLVAGEFQDNDCLVLGSYWPDVPDEIEMVRTLRERSGTRLITISPHETPVEPRTDVLLHEVADVAIDNGAGSDGGLFEVEGVDRGILSYARDVNLTINQAIVAEYIQTMVEAGRPPTQFYLVHYPYFAEIQDVMWKRIDTYGY